MITVTLPDGVVNLDPSVRESNKLKLVERIIEKYKIETREDLNFGERKEILSQFADYIVGRVAEPEQVIPFSELTGPEKEWFGV